MEENERCDEESVVFNARLTEDEMIITISEYEEMKKQIEKAKQYEEFNCKIRNDLRDENEKIKDKVRILEQENIKLKRGLVNFIKGLGG